MLNINFALSFILSGAFGNLIDRAINGAVADFLDFHLFGYHWPAFNLADSLVFIGVFMLIFENQFTKKKC
jgi:signal peptidase II